MSLGKLVGASVGVCLIVVIVGASAVLKAIVDVIDGPSTPYTEADYPA